MEENFLKDFKEILQREQNCFLEDKLKDYKEWDSMSMIALMCYLEKKFKIKLPLCEIQNIQKVGEIIEIIKDKQEVFICE